MKNNKNIFILFSILGLTNCMLTAQTDSTTAIKKGIGLTFSPLYSMLTNNNHASRKGEIAGSGGLSYISSINKKRNLYLSAELGYVNNGYIVNQIPNTVNLVSNSGTVNFNNVTYFNIIERYSYAYFSLGIQKTIFQFQKGLFLFGGIGMQINYCYLYTLTTKDLTDANGKNADYNIRYSGNLIPQKYTASLVFKMGLMKSISKKISIIISPIFQYGFIPQDVPSFSNVGINFQLLYKF